MKHQKPFAISLFVLAGLVLFAGAPAAWAAGPYTQIGTITIPGGVPNNDIIWIDTSTDLMYLTNSGATPGVGVVDVFDVRNDTFLYAIPGFAGHNSGSGHNGPNGVLPIPQQGELWVGDGPSLMKIVNLERNEIVATINTGGLARADEFNWDPKDHLLIVGNPSESRQTPPAADFLTVINTDTRQIQGKIIYPNATGLEQPVWDPVAERFYVPIDGNTVEVDVIDPKKVIGTCTITTGPNCGVVSQVFPSCPSISGMVLVPYQRLVTSCGIVLSMPGGSVVATINSPNGAISGDQIYYNEGDNQVYWGSTPPVVVDVSANQFSYFLNPSMGSNHVIGANSNNNHIYLPSATCGCIQVFAPSADVPSGTKTFVH